MWKLKITCLRWLHGNASASDCAVYVDLTSNSSHLSLATFHAQTHTRQPPLCCCCCHQFSPRTQIVFKWFFTQDENYHLIDIPVEKHFRFFGYWSAWSSHRLFNMSHVVDEVFHLDRNVQPKAHHDRCLLLHSLGTFSRCIHRSGMKDTQRITIQWTFNVQRSLAIRDVIDWSFFHLNDRYKFSIVNVSVDFYVIPISLLSMAINNPIKSLFSQWIKWV